MSKATTAKSIILRIIRAGRFILVDETIAQGPKQRLKYPRSSMSFAEYVWGLDRVVPVVENAETVKILILPHSISLLQLGKREYDQR